MGVSRSLIRRVHDPCKIIFSVITSQNVLAQLRSKTIKGLQVILLACLHDQNKRGFFLEDRILFNQSEQFKK